MAVTIEHYSETFKARRPVAQEHSMGCAIACAAFIAGVGYDDALKLVKKPENAWTNGFYCPEIVKILSQLGFKFRWRRVVRLNSVEDVPRGSILFIAPCKAYPQGHFVVKVGFNKFMNPWKNFPSIRSVKAGWDSKLHGPVTYLVYPAGPKSI